MPILHLVVRNTTGPGCGLPAERPARAAEKASLVQDKERCEDCSLPNETKEIQQQDAARDPWLHPKCLKTAIKDMTGTTGKFEYRLVGNGTIVSGEFLWAMMVWWFCRKVLLFLGETCWSGEGDVCNLGANDSANHWSHTHTHTHEREQERKQCDKTFVVTSI